jgi:hypothetical protein
VPLSDALAQLIELPGFRAVLILAFLVLVLLGDGNQMVKGFQRGGIKGPTRKASPARPRGTILARVDLREIEKQGMLPQTRFTVNKQGVGEPFLGQRLAEPFLGFSLTEGARECEVHESKARKVVFASSPVFVMVVTGSREYFVGRGDGRGNS